MSKGSTREFSIFTGCLIPSKFPFIEVASRRVLKELGLKVHDIDGSSCCPNQMAIQSTDKDLWYTIAARNLALAEVRGFDIVSLCNGCYDTLKTVNSKLRSDGAFRDRINERLKEHGLEFRGTIEVKHVLQVLHDDVGINTIDKAVKIPLGRFTFSPFVGCHVKRPMDHMGFDDPEDPYYLRDLIKATGAKVKRYPEQDDCCGGGFSIGRKDDVVPAARRVLRSVKEEGSDGLVVNCPYCFAQFFAGERKVKEIYFEGLELPILYITQLLGLAMGIDPLAMGMQYHFAASVGNEQGLMERIRGEVPEGFYNEEVTRAQLEICKRCLACTDDCPAAMTVPEYEPEEVLDLILDGKYEEAIERADFWYCVNCHECTQHCPQGFGMVRLWVHLKNLAVERGIRPEVLEHRMEELEASGYSFTPDEELREECGLDCMEAPDIESFRKLIEDATRESE